MKQASNESAAALAVAHPQSDNSKLTVAQMSAADVMQQVSVIREIMEAAMQEGIHYGKIPGTDKPTLLLPGAQKLGMTFRFRTSFPKVERVDLPGGHREVFVTVRIEDGSGNFMGEGLGSCTTMESKYRFRKTSSYEPTEHLVPQSFWKLKDKREKTRLLAQIMDDVSTSYGVKKIPDDPSGVWYIVKYTGDGQKEEYENPADYHNTILKIGKKRAFVDAILTVTAAGDLFTQDLEDLDENAAALQSETGNEYKGVVRDEQASTQTTTATNGKTEKAAQADKTPGNWRDNVIHFKSSLKDRRLGDLTKADLELIRDQWIGDPRFWGKEYEKTPGKRVTYNPTAQDLALKAHVLQALGELSEAEKAAGDASSKPSKDWDVVKYYTNIEDTLAERGISMSAYFEILRRNNQIPDGVEWVKLDDVDDPEWLKMASMGLESLLKIDAMRTKAFPNPGQTAPPKEEKPDYPPGAEPPEGAAGAPTASPAPAQPPAEHPLPSGHVKAPAKPRKRAPRKAGK